MKATEANLLDFIRRSPQFVIPIYQRTYSWTEKECHQLWADIVRTGADGNISVHFIGSIVYIEKGQFTVAGFSPLLVIDGQQRLTTVILLLAALANVLEGLEPIDGFSQQKLRNRYLLNPGEDGEQQFKLILSQTDKTSLISILDGAEQPQDYSLRVTENFHLFDRLIRERKDDLATVCKGLAKLMVVDLALTRDRDNPQLIFESMNSTGRELSQADLIRNYILMGLEPVLQTKLYERYWRPMEVKFGQEAYVTHFDGFMRYFLTVKTGALPKISEVYDTFKSHAHSPQVAEAGVEQLVADIHTYAGYYCAMRLGTESDSALKLAFQDLRELKVDVADPFLLELYHDYALQRLNKDEFLTVVRLVESYIFRRSLCLIPNNSMNKTFATFAKAIDKNRYLESIQAHFLLLPSYRRFPTNEEFKREFQTKDLYNFRNRSYWLRLLENYDRREWSALNDYTIEHILPQNPKLSLAWQTALGSDWQRIQQTYLHTLGNLTLTAYNSEYSDRPFLEKRDLENGFKESPLKLNRGLGSIEQWDETAICQRADRLSTRALDVWIAPKLSAEVLESHKSKPVQAGYTSADHPQLLSSSIREIFEAVRKEILALDSCVTEEFLKVYIAYKAETNFVDIAPQAKRLRIFLNLPFAEINDPKGLCKDVSNVGRWGNGDVEVGLTSLAEIPYAIGLVRQALERQMGGGE